MKNIKYIGLGLAVVLSLGFSGCGESSSDSSPVSGTTTYDIWDYIASSQTITKSFDLYPTDSTFTPNGSVTIDAGKLVETVQLATLVKIDEYSNNSLTGSDTLSLLDTTIAVEGGNTLPRFVQVGQSAGGSCTLTNHFDSYTPYIGYTYSDVIELDCGDWSMFYSKNIGKVVGQNKSSFTIGDTTTITYSIGIYNPNNP